MNIINTRFEPPRHVRVNRKGSATKCYKFDRKLGKVVPTNGEAKRAEKGRK